MIPATNSGTEEWQSHKFRAAEVSGQFLKRPRNLCPAKSFVGF
jgi:hypothetical protein